MHNIIFDLDGTLINSCDEVMKCFEKAFVKSDYPLEKSRLVPDIIGPPLFDIISGLAPELKNINKLNEIVENFSYFYDNEQNDISKVYDGVYEVLDILKNKGIMLFMATLKPNVPTLRIIEQFNLKYFEDVYTIDKFGQHITKKEMIYDIIKRYNLIKEETIMIGDACSDMIAAKSAGVCAIGALWGYGTNKQPLIDVSDKTIENFRNILDLELI